MTEEQRKENFGRIQKEGTLIEDISCVLLDGSNSIVLAIFLSRSNEVHLDRFGILTEYRGKGIAKTFLLHSIRKVIEIEITGLA